MTRSICECLKEKIRDFVAEKNESLRWFSRQAGVDYTTIYRLNSGEQKTLSFLNAYRILKVLSPAGYLGILGEYYPDELRGVAGDAPSSIDRKANVAEHILRDFYAFKVYTYAATAPRATAALIREKFGTDGIDCLRKLIEIGALSERDGDIIDDIEGVVLLSDECLKQNAKFNIEMTDLLKPGSHVYNVRANLNSEGVRKWYEAAVEFKKKLIEIAADNTMKGEVVAVSSSALSPL